jgi:outer membrane protein TolC
VGPYASLIATLTPAELVQYVETERRATEILLENTRVRVQNGMATTAELVPLETKKAQLEILIRAAQRRVQAPPANRHTDLFAALTPAELVQFLSTELNGARSLRDLTRAQFQAGIVPSTELLPLEARTQQLEILVRAAERRAAKPESER